jgi:3-phosphoshikimate 1-carboxyvinyltransferase
MRSLVINPEKLSGSITAPPSKSMAHRLLICALLAEGRSVIDNVSLSDDISATIGACEALGASVEIEESPRFPGRKRVTVSSTGSISIKRQVIDCRESGSTARFIMPVSRLCGDPATFIGTGKLVERPFEIYKRLFPGKGVSYEDSGGRLPATLSGRLSPGEYELRGDVSSQFISGLLFALPRLNGDSSIHITGGLESRSYVAMTLATLEMFGVSVDHDDDFSCFSIKGGQTFRASEQTVEGDWSQAAFFCVLGAISGRVAIHGLRADSLQGDRVITEIVKKMGARVEFNGGALVVEPGELRAFSMDASQCPDLAPAVAVGAALCRGRSVICNASRLRIKESDRIRAVCEELGKIGARVEELPDGMAFDGVDHFSGACVDGWNDHRIVMALAIASAASTGPIEISGYNAVSKSYPGFWEDLKSLGGRFDGQRMG